MDRNMIVFGDLHSEHDALKFILGYADENNINVALNLGDESHLYDSPWELEEIYNLLRDWRDASSERRLICVASRLTEDVIPELRRNYVGMNEEGKVEGKSIFKEGNIIAAHRGKKILKEYGDFINNYHGPEPLVIFQAHLHAMHVLGEYRRLDDSEKVRFIKEGERHFQLNPGKVYWVSSGRACHPGKYRYYGKGPYKDIGGKAINFALYYPKERKVTLKSVFTPHKSPASLQKR